MKRIINTLSQCIREYKKPSILTPVLVAGEVVMEVIIPMVMALLIDNMTGESMTPIVKYGAILLALAMVSLFFGRASAIQGAKAATGFCKNIRNDMFDRIQDFAFADVDKFSSSSLITRMTTDVTNIQNAYGMLIRIAVRTPLMMIFSIIMAFSISPKMALIYVGIIPFLVVALLIINGKVMPIFHKIFKKYDAFNESVEENVSGIRVVKSFVREEHEQKKFNKSAESLELDFRKAEKIIAFNNPVMMGATYVAILLLCVLGAQLIVNSGAVELTTGQLSSLMSYGTQILMSLMMLSMVVIMIMMSEESMKRVCEVLEYKPTLVSPENAVEEIKDGSIDFSHVSFKYDLNSKRDALQDVNLYVPSGSTLGIIGGTGSSKSTLVMLIPRLYEVTSGELRVGGKNVKDYDLVKLRDSVAMVLQKNQLFSGTIYENMRWGNPNATDAEIEAACKAAQADEFVRERENGYNTMISQGGSNVSGGQKQRLCIARALLKKPKILILDDSTSAVDTKTDALIRKSMSELLPDTTKIIIAQRVSSVEDADKIIVMDNGRIVEQGTSEELIAQKGLYNEIYELQTKNSGKEEN